MSSSVGIRELKDHLSAVLEQVKRGTAVTVTDRRQPIAIILPVGKRSEATAIQELVRAGRLSWSGGKPKGSARPPVVRGPSVSDAVIEDRR